MQIEEKQIVINGQNIILRSPKKQDAETFSEVRDITYRETYFLARYPEETDFTAEAAEAMISDIAERREEFLIGAFRKEQMIGCVMVLKEGNHIKFRHKAGIGIFYPTKILRNRTWKAVDGICDRKRQKNRT